jgi:hypothetical protein
MVSGRFVVFLHPTQPTELRELLDDYFWKDSKNPPYLVSQSVEQVGSLFELYLLQQTSDVDAWRVQIPLAYVLLVADMAKPNTPGFI